jgi:uncharacterized protein YceH (UPF0502 family)
VDWQAKAHGADRASWATERAELRARIAKLEKQVRELRGQLERRGEDTGAPSGIGDRRGPTGAKRD